MKRWYVVQVYTGSEEVVKADLLKCVEEEGLQELFGDVVVPTSKVTERFAVVEEEGKREKIFPGYLLVQMEMNGDSRRLVIGMSRVSRFLGGISPMALSDAEVEKIFAQISGECAVSSSVESYGAGNEVHVAAGPFAGFVGIVESVDEEHERVRVMVSIFGRMTPIELGFDQISR
ncbi:transcription termination/antitermination protein NusG [Candidatus Dependentiae bacterium]